MGFPVGACPLYHHLSINELPVPGECSGVRAPLSGSGELCPLKSARHENPLVGGGGRGE